MRVRMWLPSWTTGRCTLRPGRRRSTPSAPASPKRATPAPRGSGGRGWRSGPHPRFSVAVNRTSIFGGDTIATPTNLRTVGLRHREAVGYELPPRAGNLLGPAGSGGAERQLRASASILF